MMKRAFKQEIKRCLLKSGLLYILLLLTISVLSGTIVYRRSQSLLVAALVTVLISYLYKDKRKYFTVWGTLSTLLASVLFIYYQVNDSSQIYLTLKYLSFSVSLSCLILLAATLGNQIFIKKIISVLFLFFVLIIPVIFWGYYLSMDAWFASDTLLAIMQTNLGEAKEYLSDYFSYRGVISAIIIIIVGLVVWRSIQGLLLVREKQHFVPWLFLAMVSTVVLCYATRNNAVVNIGLDAKKNLHMYDEFQKMQLQRKNNVKVTLSKHNTQQGIFVLIIGESQNKNHMSAYGYERKTTPWLDDAFKQNNFIKFNKAYSCHTHTVPVLTYALTAKNQYNDLPLEKAVSILEVAEAAGYETVWLSNQAKYGTFDTPITVIASEANQQDWINHNIGETVLTNVYDLKLLDSLASVKFTDKMLIVIHLMGNHSSYAERYPQDFSVFSGKNKDIDRYDNSILYNDYVVGKIYERVKKLPDFKGMIYFADHSDVVNEKLGHDSGKFAWDMTHIPMYMAFSDEFVAEKPDVIAALRNSQDKYFTNDLIFNTVLGIMHIEVPKVYEQENDITAAQYNADIQRFKTLYGKKMLVEELQ